MTIKDLQQQLQTDIDSLKWTKEPKELYEPLDYTMQLGGKRMRPLLAALSYLLFKNDVNKVLPICRAVEVFHNFTLIHDDIMDNAPLRRGKETVYRKWNSNIAILSGDVMMVKAYELLNQVDADKTKELLTIFNEGAIKVCEGQQWDMNFELRADVSVKDYIQMIYLKTAALLEHAMQMGAVYADAPQEDVLHLKEFAKNLGISFQLKDDWLDAFGDSDKVGKQKGGDILANKKTFLLLKALEIGNSVQKDILNMLSLEGVNSEIKVERTLSIFKSLKIDEITHDLVEDYYKKAVENLNAVKSDSPLKVQLLKYIEDLMYREF